MWPRKLIILILMLADNRNYPRDEPSICFPFLNCLLLEAENQKTILQRFSNSNKSFFRCFIHLFKIIHSDGNFSLFSTSCQRNSTPLRLPVVLAEQVHQPGCQPQSMCTLFFFFLLIRKKPHREFTLTVTENPSRVKFSLEDQISDHTTGLMLLYSYDVENWPSTLSFFLSQWELLSALLLLSFIFIVISPDFFAFFSWTNLSCSFWKSPRKVWKTHGHP